MAQIYHLLHSVVLLGLLSVSRSMIISVLFLSGPINYYTIRNDPRFRRLTLYDG